MFWKSQVERLVLKRVAAGFHVQFAADGHRPPAARPIEREVLTLERVSFDSRS